jgi:hypothetical protein
MGENDREMCPTPERPCHFNEVEWGKLLAGMSGLRDSVTDLKVTVRQQGAETKKEITTQITSVWTRLDKQNGRIGKLENWRWYILGAFGAALLFLKIGGVL